MHRDFAEWYSAGGRIANPRRIGTSLRYGGSAKMPPFPITDRQLHGVTRILDLR